MQLTPYLSFDGNCREAFAFYASLMGGEVTAMMPFSDAPAEDAGSAWESCMSEAPAGWSDKIMHACIAFGDMRLMASDCMPSTYHRPQGTFIHVEFPEPGEAERVFDALADGGTTVMPMQETFWAHAFGMTVDRFGTPWMVSRGRPM